MGSLQEFTAGGKPAVGYLAAPRGGKGPGVLLVHAWWGLNPFFRAFCDRLATEGFVVFAPDLYHGRTARIVEEAKVLRSGLKSAAVRRELLAAVDHLRKAPAARAGSMGIFGFSLGAYWALWLVCDRPADFGAAVVFYGARKADYRKTKAAFLAHFAEKDPFVSPAAAKNLADSLRGAGREATVHVYPGTSHWFFEEDRPDAYDAEAAGLAWQRTIDFLHERLDVTR